MMRTCTLMIATGLWLAGCATPPAPVAVAPFRDPAMTLQAARDTVTPGKTSRAELAASLGPANKVRFASGFEIWIYRDMRRSNQPPGSPPELVLLLDPSGIVRKTRIKPAYPP